MPAEQNMPKKRMICMLFWYKNALEEQFVNNYEKLLEIIGF